MFRKSIILISLITILGSIMAQAQPYVPFPDSNAVWFDNITIDCAQFGIPTYSAEFCDILGINGDTTINSTGYSKLYEYADSNLLLSQAIYIGGLREDSLKRIYIWEDSDTNECLMYDFSKGIGDTITSICAQWNFTYVVNSIDSVPVQGQYRKRHFLDVLSSSTSFSSYVYWIEGIGSEYGLYHQIDYIVKTCAFYKLLHKFLINDTLVYSLAPNNWVCRDFVGINENSQLQGLGISPNPFDSYTVLTVNDHDLHECSYVLFNTLGQVVRTEYFANANNITIEKGELLSGIYVIVVVDNDNVIGRTKLVVR